MCWLMYISRAYLWSGVGSVFMDCRSQRRIAIQNRILLRMKKEQMDSWYVVGNIHDAAMVVIFHYSVVSAGMRAVLALDVQRERRGHIAVLQELRNMPSALCVHYLLGHSSCTVDAFCI